MHIECKHLRLVTWRGMLGVCALLAGLLVPCAATSTPPASGPATTPAEEPPAAARTYKLGAIITIDSEISEVTYDSIKRRTEQAQKQGADLIVFRLDTPGGLVSSTLKICDLIKALPQHSVAWVNTKAYSGGAIVALSCNEILMSKRSTIGDAQPIMFGTEGPTAVPKSVEAKVTSPLYEELRDSAQRNGHNMLLCEAMIRPDMEVFWVQNVKTGQKRFVTREQRNEIFGLTTTLPAGATQPVETSEISRTDWQYVTAVPLIPVVDQPIVGKNELLTMTQNEAIAFGFARPKMISSISELEDYYGLPAPPRELTSNWSEQLVAWLTSPVVRSILLVIALIAGYIELNHPGVLLPGLVAAVFLALFLGAPYLAGLANLWDILLVAAGLILIGLEIFVIPGFGIAGIIGVAILLIGLIATFVPADWPDQGPFHLPTTQYAWVALQNGIIAVSVSLVASLIGMIVLSRYFGRMPYLNKLVLANPQPQQVSLEDWFGSLPQPGEEGVTIGPLRPAGKARFGDKLADVVAEGDFIEPDQPIEVLERIGNRIVVRRIAGRTDAGA